MRLWVIGAAVVLGSCTRVSTTFTPAKAEYAETPTRMRADHAVRLARVAYPGDIPELLSVGGEIIGRIDGAGNAFASQDAVATTIRRDAAAQGATHVVLISSHEEEDYLPVAYQTRCVAETGGAFRTSTTANCTTTPVGTRITRPRASYVLVRVPGQRRDELSVALGGYGAPPATDEGTAPSRSEGGPTLAELYSATNQPETNQRISTEPPPSDEAINEAREFCYEYAKKKFGKDAAHLDSTGNAAAPGQPSLADRYVATMRPDQAQRAAQKEAARKEQIERQYARCVEVRSRAIGASE